MGECEFCSSGIFSNGRDITKRLGARMIRLPEMINDNNDIYRLEAWLLRDELVHDKAKMHIDVTKYGEGNEFTAIDIPVKYCPRCGRQL